VLWPKIIKSVYIYGQIRIEKPDETSIRFFLHSMHPVLSYIGYMIYTVRTAYTTIYLKEQQNRP
jgi:hypothetical protein